MSEWNPQGQGGGQSGGSEGGTEGGMGGGSDDDTGGGVDETGESASDAPVDAGWVDTAGEPHEGEEQQGAV
jgi:hypothetical protein